MRILNSSSQNLYLVITFLFVFMVHLKAQKDSRENILEAHNKARGDVGVGPLKWDETLVPIARYLANQQILVGELHYSKELNYGQNIAWVSGNFTFIKAFKLWMREKSKYDYESNSCSSESWCGQYTQIVWNDTEKIGCAKAISKYVFDKSRDLTYVVCMYDPAGNWIGRKPY